MSIFLSHIPENPTKDSKCIIMLHGVGSNQDDLFGLAPNFHEDTYVFSLEWCFSLGNDRYAWYPVDFSTGKPLYKTEDVERGYQYILQFIEDISQTYKLTPDQIFPMWFSQGAIMSYYLLYRSPELIGGIIALSGRLLTEIDTTDFQIENYIWKKVFIGHGNEDRVISVESSNLTTQFVRELSLEPTVHIYQIGHTISQTEMTDISNWL